MGQIMNHWILGMLWSNFHGAAWGEVLERRRSALCLAHQQSRMPGMTLKDKDWR